MHLLWLDNLVFHCKQKTWITLNIPQQKTQPMCFLVLSEKSYLLVLFETWEGPEEERAIELILTNCVRYLGKLCKGFLH